MTPSHERILDDLWSKAVRANAKGQCQWSGRPGDECGAQACHIVGRRYLSTRWGAVIDGQYDLCGFYANWKIHRGYDQHESNRATTIEKLIGRKRYDAIIKKAQEDGSNQDFDTIAKILRGYK
jgi:hypothetical protein